MRRKLGIFGQKMEGEASALFLDLTGEQIPRPADKAAGAELMARPVQVTGVPQIPKSAARAEPAFSVILRVAVGGYEAVAVRVGLVDLGKKVGRHEIVRVENEIGIVAIGAVVAVDRGEKEVEDVTLSALLLVFALVNDGAVRRGDAGGIVGAVVRADKDVVELPRVVLCLQTVDEVRDDPLLVARRDQHGEAVRDGLALVRRVLFEESDKDI